jgi:hypothetical protein
MGINISGGEEGQLVLSRERNEVFNPLLCHRGGSIWTWEYLLRLVIQAIT